MFDKSEIFNLVASAVGLALTSRRRIIFSIRDSYPVHGYGALYTVRRHCSLELSLGK